MRPRSEEFSAITRILLRQVIDKLVQSGPGSDYYDTRVHNALMHSGDLGHKCGIVVAHTEDGEVRLIAVMELPTGTMAFEIQPLDGSTRLPSQHEHLAAARRFLEVAPEYTFAGNDPYAGHCRECYVWKGYHGGECVNAECKCHWR